jgi:hypothetical protein
MIAVVLAAGFVLAAAALSKGSASPLPNGT